ncbi:hypothetical protein NL108_015052 [Boleophthalmus pectinirostris]|nr:hypothetical protein NL108_015052 [Boleophthalmus pectinirostris]
MCHPSSFTSSSSSSLSFSSSSSSSPPPLLLLLITVDVSPLVMFFLLLCCVEILHLYRGSTLTLSRLSRLSLSTRRCKRVNTIIIIIVWACVEKVLNRFKT